MSVDGMKQMCILLLLWICHLREHRVSAHLSVGLESLACAFVKAGQVEYFEGPSVGNSMLTQLLIRRCQVGNEEGKRLRSSHPDLLAFEMMKWKWKWKKWGE